MGVAIHRVEMEQVKPVSDFKSDRVFLSGSDSDADGGTFAEEIRIRQDGDAAIAVSFEELLALRNPQAFPALLAHHPHAFDPAAAAQLPISLSGHTHGAS